MKPGPLVNLNSRLNHSHPVTGRLPAHVRQLSTRRRRPERRWPRARRRAQPSAAHVHLPSLSTAAHGLSSKPTLVLPPRSPLACLGSPPRRLVPRTDEVSKKAPQAPHAPPPRVTELCSSQAASLKTTPKPLRQTVPPPWTPPHHRPPPATDRPRRQSSSITPLRSSSPTREPPALLTRQRHHRRLPLA
jgi:hypothetical protein